MGWDYKRVHHCYRFLYRMFVFFLTDLTCGCLGSCVVFVFCCHFMVFYVYKYHIVVKLRT